MLSTCSNYRRCLRADWSLPGTQRLSVLLVLLFCLTEGLACSRSATAQEERRKNQLGDLFRQLDRGIREGAEEIKNSKSTRDQFDIRPVQRPEENRRFQQAKNLVQQGKWNNAVEVLQFLMEQPNDAFSVNDAHEFRSLQNEVDRMIGGLPPEGMRNYESRYGAAAQQQLDAALETQDEALLIQVSTHFFHTPAGQHALSILACKWQDQGQFGRSAEAWLRLYEKAVDPERTQIGKMAARALSRAGRIAEAEKIAGTLPDADNLFPQLQQQPLPPSTSRDPRGPYLQFFGSDQSVKDVNPSLLPRWTASIIERFNADSQMEMLSSELRELGRTLIPTLQPLAVQDKFAIRTLRSLQVRSISTGGVIWERRMPGSPEELVTTGNPESILAFEEYRFSPDTQVEQHPLTSLLYRDEVYGSLSSDGARLYAVESTGAAALSTPLHLWQLRVEGSAARTPWSTNELTAYDLNTGLIRWRLGGIAIEKEFSRPLAGTRFLAAPVPDGPELYVLGERNGEIVLFCLAAQSGETLWEQPLASPGRPIREDLIRSHWACQPVLTDGLVLCPTTSGWMVAVDRVNHRLKWSARFSPRVPQQEQFRSSYSSPILQELNRRWEAVVTLVARDKVLVTPPELPDEFNMMQPMLYCLDLQTGKTLWEQPKAERSGGTGLYLAGIWNNQVVIVGTHHVTTRSLEKSGDIVSNIALPDRPTGRGVLSEDHLLLPVRGSRLLKINLKTSAMEKTLLPAVEGELGNLVLHQGQLLAASYQSVIALPADLGRLQNDADPEILARAQLGESKLLLAEKQFEKLESSLEQILKTPSLPAGLRLEVADIQRLALHEQLRAFPTNAETLLARLEKLSQTPEERRDFQRIRADHWLESGQLQQALPALLDILETFPASERIQEGTLTLRIDSWVHGQLKQLFEAVSDPAIKETFQKEIETRVQAIRNRSSDSATLDRWARALAFNTAGLQLELDLAETDFQRGARAAGLIRLCRVAECEYATRRAQALRQLATRLAELGWHQDALAAWTRLQQLPIETFSDQELSSELAAAGISAAQKALEAPSESPSRWGKQWMLERVGVSGNERNFESVTLAGTGFEAADDLRLIQESDHSRIRLEERRTGHSLTSFPLRSSPVLEHNPSVGARLLASTIYVVHGGILHAIAWPDQEMTWTWSSDVHGMALSRLAMVQPQTHFRLQSVQQFAATRQLQTARSQTGYLQAANLRALLVYCKDWIALDPITGEELWRDRVPVERSSAQELGADWFIVTGRSGQSVRSAFNGLPRSARPPYESNNRPILINGNDFILLNRSVRTVDKIAVHDLQRVTPQGEKVWSAEIPADALLGLPDPDSLIVLRNPAEANLIDLTTGKMVKLGNIPELAEASLDVRSKVAITSDQERIYFYIDDKDVRPFYLSLPAIQLAGKVVAINRKGERQWTYQTPEIPPSKSVGKRGTSSTSARPWALNALVQNFQDSPLLLLVGDDEREDPDLRLRFHQIRIIGLDKATGQPLIDWERPSESGGFSYLYVDSQQQTIDLRTYNERMQLTSGTATDSPSPGTAP